jgi:hypothetical protein
MFSYIGGLSLPLYPYSFSSSFLLSFFIRLLYPSSFSPSHLLVSLDRGTVFRLDFACHRSSFDDWDNSRLKLTWQDVGGMPKMKV